MKLGAYIAAAFAIVVWSVTFANTRVLLRDFSAFEILIVRFVMAWAALWSMECLGRRGGAGTSRHAVCSEWLFVGMGFTGIVVYQFLENCAIYYTNASNVAILVSFVPIATAIIARIVLKDRSLSIPLVVGSLIAICGVAVVSVGSTIELQVRPLGDLMALIAMLSWGFYSILVDIVNARGVAPITAMRKSFAWSLVIMAPFALWGATECGAHSLDGVFGVTLAVEENAARFSSVGNWANFAFLGLIASAASFAMWNFACKAIGMVKVTIGLYFTPIVGVAFAVLFLGEPLTVSGILGGALILIGVFIANRGKRNGGGYRGYRVRHGYHSKLPQVRQAKLGRTNSGRSYIVKKSTYD